MPTYARYSGSTTGGQSVTIYYADTTTKPTIYADSGGSNTKSNPITADYLGKYEFYVADGLYDIVQDTTLTDVKILSYVEGIPNAADISVTPYQAMTQTNLYEWLKALAGTGGQLQKGDGTVGAPTYSFFSDPDTGLYKSAANTWALSGGGTLGLSGNATTVTSALDLRVTTSTASSSSSTGALVVTGGVGVGGKLNTADLMAATRASAGQIMGVRWNSSNSNAGWYLGSAGEPYLASNVDYSSGDVYSRASIGPWRMGNPGGSATYPLSVEVAAAGSIGAAITWVVALKIGTSGSVELPASIASTSKTTGALVITGGLGVSGALYGATANFDGTITSTAASSVLENTAAGTAQKYVRLANTSGSVFWGIESSVAGAFFPSSSAYATVVYSSQPVEIIVSNIKVMSFESTKATSALQILSTGVGGIGYATGAGGTVTQATSKSTGVTLSKASGAITMDAANLAADTTVSFVLTNTSIAATDVLILNHISGGTVGSYLLNAQCAAGSATINVRNITTGALAEAIVIKFVLIKAVNA